MFILQISINIFLFFINILGIILNRQSIILTLICIELILLNINFNFILFSVYLNDLYGQIFALSILTIAASESAIGLAIIIANYRIRGNIYLNQLSSLKH